MEGCNGYYSGPCAYPGFSPFETGFFQKFQSDGIFSKSSRENFGIFCKFSRDISENLKENSSGTREISKKFACGGLKIDFNSFSVWEMDKIESKRAGRARNFGGTEKFPFHENK